MHTSNIVRATADVVTITHLTRGSVYKRLVDDAMRYGVVTSVLNNGEDSAIQAIEHYISYGSPMSEPVVHNGNKSIALFHAEVEEVQDFVAALMEKHHAAIKSAEQSLVTAQERLERTQQMFAMSDELQPAGVGIIDAQVVES